MPVMSDRWIRRMARDHGIIEPFVEAQKREGVISYGLSSYGYDARVADEFKIFTNINSAVVDPKEFAPAGFVDRKTDICIIPPNSFALGHTVEYFRIPRDVLVICLGKSTYARCGIIVNVTPLEPEWEGQVVGPQDDPHTHRWLAQAATHHAGIRKYSTAVAEATMQISVLRSDKARPAQTPWDRPPRKSIFGEVFELIRHAARRSRRERKDQ